MNEIISVKVRKKLASTVHNPFIVAENTDYRIVFDFDSPWETHEQKTCRLSIGDEYIDVDFTGSTVCIPSVPSTVDHIYVGVYAGELQTTTPARIPVQASILNLGDSEYDPDAPEVVPSATDITLDDLLRLNDVSAGQWVKATLRQILALAGASVDPSDDAPLMDGTASAGSSDKFARGDHVHPTDTSRVAVTDYEQLEYTVGVMAQGVQALDYAVGQNIRNIEALNTNTVHADVAQSFTAAQQAQARNNIGAASLSDIDLSAYRTAAAQDVIDGAQDTAIAAKYSKPSGGIPKTDLASAVQTSLGKADTAIAAPSSPNTGDVLTYNGSTWIAGQAGLSNDAKAALLALLEKVAYIDEHGQDYIDDFEDALNGKTLTSITAVFTQGQAVIYDTDTLDDLEQYLVVTAHYSDNSTAAVTTYTLSGTLAVGTDSITVSYRGKTTTFTVTVISHSSISFTGGASLANRDTTVYRRSDNSTTARACMDAPIANNGYSFAVTDSTKYAIAVNGVSSLTHVPVPGAADPDAVDGYGYTRDGSAASWATSGSTQASYVWVALKKNDGTAFTNEELANGAAAVITYTENA